MSRPSHVSFGFALLCVGLPLLAARPAAAQDKAHEDAEGLGSHQKNFRFDIGARTQYISNEGLDPFSENDVLPQLSLAASYGFYANEELSVAAVLGFDYGATTSRARDNATSLDVRRFVLGPEARYHVLRVLALTARVAPTLTREAAEVSTGLDTDLRKVAWMFGVDATAGAALELYGYHSGASRKPRLWVTAEGGYGWTAPNQLVLEPEEAGAAPQRLTPLDFPELSLSGPLFRVTAAISF